MTFLNNEVLFFGRNTNFNIGLWVTDGTAVGTVEVTVLDQVLIGLPAAVPSADLTVFNGEALFAGADFGLWATDGTAAGTHEIISSAGYSRRFAPPAPGPSTPVRYSPSNLTAFNGEVLFAANNADSKRGLWVTDGTAVGTHELTGISGASSQGLDPSDFAVFNGEALFSGLDTHGYYALWVTDGTVAGTHELTGISGVG